MYQTNITLPEIISKVSHANSNKVAITEYQDSIVYGELEIESNKLANFLTKCGVTSNQKVAILSDRGIKTITSILGILKCNCTYVPIDAEYPKKRIQYMLEDIDCQIIITKSAYINLIQEITHDRKIIVITTDEIDNPHVNNNGNYTVYTNKDIQSCDANSVKVNLDETTVAYIIYTSGSTGNPKGVMITHKAVLNTLFWLQDMFNIQENDIIAQKTSISFTDSVWEIFWPLMFGSKISIINDSEVKDPKKLYNWLQNHNITITQFVPAQLKIFLDYISLKNIVNPLPKLKWIFNGGEAITTPLVQEWYDLFRCAKIANIYGMTETAIYATYYIIEEKPQSSNEEIPVGKPIANTRTYILDSKGKIALKGAKGEICIGGAGLTLGYWNKPDLTQKAFIKHPNTNELLYRTGDIGAFASNGNINYFGRVDHQVQIRGNRVELQEAEKAILSHPSVKQTVVIVKSDNYNNNYLVCYLTDPSGKLNLFHLKSHLEQIIPKYMIPDKFIIMDKLPLTPHGKINRKLLIEHKESSARQKASNESISDLESTILNAWQDLLSIQNIDLDDDFFDLGGNSILVARVQIFLEKHNISIDGDVLYNHKTIRSLAAYINNQDLKSDTGHTAPVKKNTSSPVHNKEGCLIDSIRPFNDIFYKDCFYNALFPIIRYLNKDIMMFPVNDTIIYDKLKNNKGLCADIKYIEARSFNDLLKHMGICKETKNISKNIISDLRRSIQQHRPIIAKIDCFYESIRKDLYQKRHFAHDLLVLRQKSFCAFMKYYRENFFSPSSL